MTLKTYLQAQNYLESKIPSARTQKYPGQRGLERMAYFLKLLGNPQNQYPTIHVGGTAGKGSACYLISSILTKSGFKTGLHLSPHLQVIPERMQINHQLISEKKFIRLLNQLIPTIKKVAKTKHGPPTYFEILLALSFLHFAQEKVDYSVIEVGMGGQYDGTNVLEPQVIVLTNVGLDHTHILGKTVEAIAQDKKEIIKPNVPVVTGVTQSSVIKIIQKKCQQTNSPLFILNQDLHYQIKKSNQEGSVFNLKTPHHSYQNLKLSLLGHHQVKNVALAIATVEQLSRLAFTPLRCEGCLIPKRSIRQALALAHFPGRLEIIEAPLAYPFGTSKYTSLELKSAEAVKSALHRPLDQRGIPRRRIQKNPLIVLDGAHNPEKMRALVSSFPKLFNYDKLHVIFALTKTKDLINTLKSLLKITDRLIATQYQPITDLGQNFSYPAEKIAKQAKKLKPNLKITLQKNAQKALKDTIYNIGPGDALLVTGSLYLVGEIRSFFYPDQKVIQARSLYPKVFPKT